MAKRTPAEVYLEIACAVTQRSGHRNIGQGDHTGDQKAARNIREAAKAIYVEVAEEMDILRATNGPLTDRG